MAFIKFLFVIALAVPLAVFMWYFMNRLSVDFKNSVKRGKNIAAKQEKVSEKSVAVKERRYKKTRRTDKTAKQDEPKKAKPRKTEKGVSKRKRRKARIDKKRVRE